MTASPKNLCQIELAIHEKPNTLKFYQEVLGWEITSAEIHNCYIIKVPEDCPFGISLIYNEMSKKGINNSRLYFHVTELSTYQKKIESFFKKEFKSKHLQSYGDVLLFSDPCGNKYGLFKKSNNITLNRL